MQLELEEKKKTLDIVGGESGGTVYTRLLYILPVCSSASGVSAALVMLFTLYISPGLKLKII